MSRTTVSFPKKTTFREFIVLISYTWDWDRDVEYGSFRILLEGLC
jgi:hypothetical protein